MNIQVLTIYFKEYLLVLIAWMFEKVWRFRLLTEWRSASGNYKKSITALAMLLSR
jgi:hypothetical protein